MLSFKQFILEMPYLDKGVFSSKETRDKDRIENLNADNHWHKDKKFRKTSETDTHEYHTYHEKHPMGDGLRVHVINKKTKDIDAVVEGPYDHKKKELTTGWVVTRPNSMKAHDVYRHLIHNHGLTLRSSHTQSKGGAVTWNKLSKHKDVHVELENGGKYDKKNWMKHYDTTMDATDKSKLRFVARKK